MNISRIKLKNGLIVASDVMSSIETISIAVMMQTGSRNESRDNNGISHFLEHMAFKGTKTRDALKIAQEFDDIGGHFNAYTSRERTVYYAKVLKEDLEIAVDVLSDIVQNSIFDPEEIEKEREVIIQEIAQTFDTPDEALFEYFQEAAFPDQSYGRSILGTVDNVRNFSRKQIVEYVDRNYYSENIIVTAAGNLNSDYFMSLIEKKFSSVNSSGTRHTEDVLYKGGDIRIEKDLEQIQIVMAFQGVSLHDPAYYTQQVLSIILGGGMSSRLFQEVREKRGLAYFISSYGNSTGDSGIFGIYGGVGIERANEYLDVVSDELLELANTISEEEIIRANAQLRSSLLMSRESTTYRAEKFANNIADFDRYIPIEEILNDIKKVDKSSLSKFAEKLFSQNSLPTLASIGKIDKLYEYDNVIKKLTFV
jgi:predicted Zn-dependent peptidase